MITRSSTAGTATAPAAVFARSFTGLNARPRSSWRAIFTGFAAAGPAVPPGSGAPGPRPLPPPAGPGPGRPESGWRPSGKGPSSRRPAAGIPARPRPRPAPCGRTPAAPAVPAAAPPVVVSAKSKLVYRLPAPLPRTRRAEWRRGSSGHQTENQSWCRGPRSMKSSLL